MKLRFLFLLILTLFCLPAFGWDISTYTTYMQIQRDSSILVSERITADFTGDPHHGIYRDIPLSGKDKFGNTIRIRFDITGVTDGSGKPLKYVMTSQSGGRIRIKIGDPDVYVQGKQLYIINYKLLRAVHFFDRYDELYWNIVGPEWEVPVKQASAVVTLPNDAPANGLRTASYTGFYGSTTSEAMSDTPNRHTARFWMNRALNPGEIMTVVVGWPKGIVQQPALSQEIWWFVSDNGYFFLPPLFLLALVIYWMKVGRDPNTGRSEVVFYEPPDGMTPAEMGTLIDETVDVRDIAASIIDLAVRGYIHITAQVEKGFLSTKTDHLLELQKPYEEVVKDPKLNEFEQKLIRGIFGSANSKWTSELANHFYVHLPGLRSKLYNDLVIRGYFTSSPDSVRAGYLTLGIVILAAGIIGAVITSSGGVPLIISPGWFLAIAVCGAFVIVASKAMPKKTSKGRDAFIGVKGFEEYLTRAERDNIQFQEKHDLFEKFLPYALALGIADKWAHAFEGLGIEPPDWYTGYGDTFHPMLFTHDLNLAAQNWGGAMTSQPRSSGGGSSFFGGGSGFGGGSSGGGGGGGGGGGW